MPPRKYIHRIWANRTGFKPVKGIGGRLLKMPVHYENDYDRLSAIQDTALDWYPVTARSFDAAIKGWVDRNNRWENRPRILKWVRASDALYWAFTDEMRFDVHIARKTWRGSRWFWEPFPPHFEEFLKEIDMLEVECYACAGVGGCECEASDCVDCNLGACEWCSGSGIDFSEQERTRKLIEAQRRA